MKIIILILPVKIPLFHLDSNTGTNTYPLTFFFSYYPIFRKMCVRLDGKIMFAIYLFFRCSPTKSLGSRNVYNVSSATLTSYTTHADGDSLDASLPNHMGLPVVKQKHKKSTNSLPNEKMILSSLRNFLVVLALSIHSIFEGMAIGK